jgi:2-haloacid dehalogenase
VPSPISDTPFAVRAVFFDLFGTLLSLAPLADVCDRLAPGRGPEFAQRWRARQLEASWLRTVMERWADFDVVTRDSLEMTLEEFGVAPSADIAVVAGAFDELPLSDGARAAVAALRAGGLETGILTNASATSLARASSRIDVPFDHLLSVDSARRFKPHPSVYRLATEATGYHPAQIGFVTSNGWDAAGAGAAGFRVVWLRPDPAAMPPAVGAPRPVIAGWREVPEIFAATAAAARQP